MESAIAFMQNTVANAKTIIQETIEYQHIDNAEVIETTTTTATVMHFKIILIKIILIKVSIYKLLEDLLFHQELKMELLLML